MIQIRYSTLKLLSKQKILWKALLSLTKPWIVLIYSIQFHEYLLSTSKRVDEGVARNVVKINRSLSILTLSVLLCILEHFYATSHILKDCASLQCVFSVSKLETRSEKAALPSQKHTPGLGQVHLAPKIAEVPVFLVASSPEKLAEHLLH